MNNKTLYSLYLFPTLLHIFLVTVIAGVLKKVGFELGYHSTLGNVLIILGGISSALWGVIYQKKCHRKKPLEILKEFFDVRQTIKGYLLVVIFLIVDFGTVILSNGFRMESPWLLFMLFLKALVLGGIEEIGWRYSFQPDLEKKFPYVVATIMTFICWGVWHFLFFYIDGSLTAVDIPFFFLELLTNSFILSALFAYSNSLWICAMTYALINAFSQISVNGNEMTSMILRLACIDLAIMLFYLSRKKRQ